MHFNWVVARLSPPEGNNWHCILFSRIQCPVGCAEQSSTTQEEGHAKEGIPGVTGYLGTVGTLPCAVPMRSMVARVVTLPRWASLIPEHHCPRSILLQCLLATGKVALISRHHILRSEPLCQLLPLSTPKLTLPFPPHAVSAHGVGWLCLHAQLLHKSHVEYRTFFFHVSRNASS